MNLTARDLILSLLDSAPEPQIRAASLIEAGALFDIDPRAIRVAATRLVKDEVLTTSARGVYTVGGRGDRLHRTVTAWANIESTLKPWDGAWVAVYQAHLKRANKTAMRARERALRLKGFAAVDANLALRPANLTLTLTAIREGLIELGLDENASALLIRQTEPELEFASLWDTTALESRYQRHIRELQRSTRRVADLDTFAAAKETLLTGREVTRDIVMDPLLPREMVDTDLRTTMIEQMKGYDVLGKNCWRAFYTALAS